MGREQIEVVSAVKRIVHCLLEFTTSRGGRLALDETRGAVIASAAKQSRAAKRTSDRDCFVASLLAMTRPRFLSCYRSSYRSSHSGLDPLIRSIFFCREPALICFSRAMAPDASYPAS